MTSCGAFRRTTSEMQDPSNYQRIMVVNDNHDNASAVEKNSSPLPNKDVVKEEKSISPNNINNYQHEDEEVGRISDYDGPMFMKSPSFRDFVRPIDLVDDSVKKGGFSSSLPSPHILIASLPNL